MTHRYHVGVDIGGTFTDCVLLDSATGRIRIHKCLTTRKDPAVGALAGLEELLQAAGLGLPEIGHLVHGTTLVTNAIIEREGARLGLLTTRGVRDALELGIEQRYDIYDLFLRFPEPLAPRELRREIDERVSRDGDVVTPIDLGQVRREVADLVGRGAEALAVCFLHAYRNPAHERAVRELVAREFPQLAVSLSAEVVPEIREYERASTTAANAYVQPLVARYVARLEAALRARGHRGRFTFGGSETIQLSGPTTVNVSIGDLADRDGNGREEVPTELVQMELRGATSTGVPVTVRVRDPNKHPNRRSIGQIEEVANNTPGVLDIPPFTATGSATSFFDVVFEVEVAGQVLHTDTPKRMQATITHKPPASGETYQNADVTELLDENEQPTGLRIVRVLHTPNP